MNRFVTSRRKHWTVSKEHTDPFQCECPSSSVTLRLRFDLLISIFHPPVHNWSHVVLSYSQQNWSAVASVVSTGARFSHWSWSCQGEWGHITGGPRWFSIAKLIQHQLWFPIRCFSKSLFLSFTECWFSTCRATARRPLTRGSAVAMSFCRESCDCRYTSHFLQDTWALNRWTRLIWLTVREVFLLC